MRGKKAGNREGNGVFFCEMCPLPLELEGFKCIHCFLLLLLTLLSLLWR